MIGWDYITDCGGILSGGLIKNKMERKEDNVLSMLQQLGKKQLLLVK